MKKEELKSHLNKMGIETKNNRILKSALKKVIADGIKFPTHLTDELLSGFSFEALILTVINDSRSYAARDDKVKLKAEIENQFIRLLNYNVGEAKFSFKDNLDMITKEVLKNWED